MKKEELKALLEKCGFSVDRWGNYTRSSGDTKHRIKIQDKSVRFEYKRNTGRSWHNLFWGRPIYLCNLLEIPNGVFNTKRKFIFDIKYWKVITKK